MMIIIGIMLMEKLLFGQNYNEIGIHKRFLSNNLLEIIRYCITVSNSLGGTK